MGDLSAGARECALLEALAQQPMTVFMANSSSRRPGANEE
jgi:hypothetical protein